MADEPRRSGRATKGQHTKNTDDDPPPQAKGKKGKKAKEEPEEDAEDNSIVRCICGATEDLEGWPMVCCDGCEAWQHNMCMDITEDEDKLPAKYFCEICDEKAHKKLLLAKKRGEKPWEEKIARRKAEEAEEARRKKQKKGKRKSEGTTTPAKVTPVPEANNKRKFEETKEVSVHTTEPERQADGGAKPASASESPAVSAPAKGGRRRSSISASGDAKRRKSSVPNPLAPQIVKTIDDLPPERQKGTAVLQAKIHEVTDKLVKSGQYTLPEAESTSTLSTRFALQIESALLQQFGSVPKYGEQWRIIFSNIPKNPRIVLDYLHGELFPYELVDMTSADMANDEVRKKRAIAKAEADKHAVLITEDGPRMRKTHKGDEIIGGDDTARHVADDSWATSKPRERHEEETATDAGSPQEATTVELAEDESRKPSLAVDTSRKYDLGRAWGSARSPETSYGAVQTPRSAANPAHSPDNHMHDADIDRLLEDDDERVPSPLDEGSDVVWKGKIDMAGVAEFEGMARWVAGCDAGQKVPYPSLVARKMIISGRIDVARADEYVSGMRWSSSNDVCCLAISPRGGPAQQESWRKIYDYFSSKSKWGVVSSGMHDSVRDTYIVTLDKGSGEAAYPGFLAMLGEINIEHERAEDILLLTMVIKTKSPRATPQIPQHGDPSSASATPLPSRSSLGGPTGSPVVSHGTYMNGSAQPPSQTPPLTTLPEWAIRYIPLLGPHVTAPAVHQLFAVVPELTDQQVRNLKAALDQDSAARNDLGRLGEVLKKSSAADGVQA